MLAPRRWRDLAGSMRVRILAAVVALLAASSAVSILLLRESLLARLDDEITLDLRQEMEEFELLAGGTNPRTGEPFGQDIAAVFDVYFAREVPDEGETLLAFIGGELYHVGGDVHHTERADQLADTDTLLHAVDYWLSLSERRQGELQTPAGKVHYIATPISGAEQDGLFVVAHFPDVEQGEIDDAVRGQAVVQAAMIVLASVFGWWLAGRVLQPLVSLAETARTISETDLTRRIPVRGDDEASRIAVAFNDMLARLDAAFATQRRFLDEASHEMRAPLTVIRGHLDLLDMEDDTLEREEIRGLVTREIERMNRMVEDLLTLARAERPDFLSPAPVDLTEWTGELFRHASVLCQRAWTLDATARGTALVDRQRLTQAVMQLAENACVHTDPGTAVHLGSALDDGSLRLWVHDTGHGVPAGEEERIFRRFHRANSRRRGTGLGLSIVCAIAEAHGGDVRLVPAAGSGARFELTVPAWPEQATT